MTGLRGHHAFLAGLIGGLVLDQVTLVVLAIGFGLGFFASSILRGASAVWRYVRDRLPETSPNDRKPW